jgi:hypothetical protein
MSALDQSANSGVAEVPDSNALGTTTNKRIFMICPRTFMLLHLTIKPRREVAALTDWTEQKYKLRVAPADGITAARSSLNGVSASPFKAARYKRLYFFQYGSNNLRVDAFVFRVVKGVRRGRLLNVRLCSVTSTP